MRVIYLHSIPFWVMTPEELEAHSQVNLADCIDLQNGSYLYHHEGLSRRELVLATGHDEGHIDYALPQDWYRRQVRETGQEPIAVWSYEKASVFGEALYASTMLHELVELARIALIKEE